MPTTATGPSSSPCMPWRRGRLHGQLAQDLQWLADQCADDDVILAGDFNATVDHMGGLGVDGGDLGRCHDAAVATGNGSVGTWSSAIPPWPVPRSTTSGLDSLGADRLGRAPLDGRLRQRPPPAHRAAGAGGLSTRCPSHLRARLDA